MAIAQLRPLPPAEAIAALERRGIRLGATWSWEDAWQADHAAMFTVAKSAGFDILKDIHDAMTAAIAEGTTIREFSARLRPALEAKGWWGRREVADPITGTVHEVQLGSPRRLRTIFETNMRVSYAEGHWARFERGKATRPYLRYVAILDGRTRPAHRARHNLCLPVDDPYWDTWAPPCGWGCRCTLQSLSERDVDRMRGELRFEPPPDTYRTYVNRRTGVVSRVPDGIDPGWAYNPGKTGLTARSEQGRYDIRNYSSFDNETNDATVREIERDIYNRSISLPETEAEKASIRAYSGEAYTEINGYLRKRSAAGRPEDASRHKSLGATITGIDAVLTRTKIEENLIVHRGVKGQIASRLRAAPVGTVVVEPGYVSTSLLRDVTDAFGTATPNSVRLKLLVPAGNSAYTMNGRDASRYPQEHEILLPRGTRYRIVSVSGDEITAEVL